MQLSEMVQRERLVNKEINSLVIKMQSQNKTSEEIQNAKRKILKWYEENPNFDEIPKEILGGAK